MASAVRVADGTYDFSGGVDSGRTATVQSQNNPNGLPRTMLAWLINGTVRGGSIGPRNGWSQLVNLLLAGVLFQGGYLYEPVDGSDPYFILSIGGRIYQVLADAPHTLTDLSAKFKLTNPAGIPKAFFAQGEQFLVIQAGDLVTLPLFWDGTTLRRSLGLNPTNTPATSYSLTVTIGWTVPAVGAVAVVNLSAPYQGNVGDVLTWGGYGVFTVNQISGNAITVVTDSSTQSGATVPPGTYVVNVAAGPPNQTYTVTTTTNVVISATNTTLSVTLSAPYAGNVGDTIQWIGVGTFTVLGLTDTLHRVSLLMTFNQLGNGATIVAGTYTWGATPPINPSPNTYAEVTTTTSPLLGGPGWTFSVTLSAPFACNVGDTLYWIAINRYGVANCTVSSVTGGGTILGLTVTFNIQGVNTSAPAGNYIFVDVPLLSPASNTPMPEPELPAAGPMVYYQGRIWYAFGRQYTAGDIVAGPSGTTAYNFTDSILKVTENPLAIGGDGFIVPSDAGDITALDYTANDNQLLGEGPLYIFTRKQIYQLVVPVSRTDWIAANAAQAPTQTLTQRKYGTTSDRCVVAVNSDLFYQTMEPAIRSLKVSVRNDNEWVNVALSRNEQRILGKTDRTLMDFATGIEFDNRLWQAVLPKQTSAGVAFSGVVPLDFDIISSFGQETENANRVPPAWEGAYDGLDILQLFEGDFGGIQRGFAVMVSRVDGTIQIWEINAKGTEDLVGAQDNRIAWQFESPAYTWNREFDMKELDGAEFFVDSIEGTVRFKVEYRVDSDACWQFWGETEFCATASPTPVDGYPAPTFCKGFKFPITLAKPRPGTCDSMNIRPTNRGYQFQVRVTVLGTMKMKGMVLWALPLERQPFENINCGGALAVSA